jgi:nicotinamide riboside transporter PnuC
VSVEVVSEVCGMGIGVGLLQAMVTSIIRPKQNFIGLIFSKGFYTIVFSLLLYSCKKVIM